MTTTMLSLVNDDLTPKEGDQICYEGDQPVYVVVKQGVTTIADPVMYVYKGSSDKSSTNTTGSINASGNQVVLKTLISLTQGDYKIRVRGTCDGILMVFCAFTLHVWKLSS